jgi:homopolymeric O-antigen transport system permease protein
MKGLLNILAQWYLVLQLANRQIRQRYRGSALGVLWLLIRPLLRLVIYTFVFGVIFQAHYGLKPSESTLEFGLIMFLCLNLFDFCAEMIGRGPGLIHEQPNLVKKVVFPLEILPVVAMLNALFHCLVAFIPLLIGFLIVQGSIPWTIVFIPVYLIPLALFATGCTYFLSALGVFVRDLQSLIVPLVNILFWSSAVFFPLKKVPDNFRLIFDLNPIVNVMESARRAVFLGVPPDPGPLIRFSVEGLVFLLIGLYFFEKSKPAFADVM